MKILQLHLWLQNKKETWTEPEVLRFSKKHPEGVAIKGKRVVLEPESQSIASIKLQVAKELLKYRNQLKSYYVVVAVERSDGSAGYRTIVPRIIIT